MAFRPCIDLKDGRVVQIVGGTLTESGHAQSNFVSIKPAHEFATMFRNDHLCGGHVIMLGPENVEAGISTLTAYPGGLQIGGGITPENARDYLNAGASHVIVTSYLFINGEFNIERLKNLSGLIGKPRLVVDLSCRKVDDDTYRVASNRWQTITSSKIDQNLISECERYCAELLVHAADVEGKQTGIDRDLVTLLAKWVSVPTTYAGGAKSVNDIRDVENLSGHKIDLTIGSALDIYGGATVKYKDAIKFARVTN